MGLPDGGARVALVLGGGNALGAYHAGFYEAIDEAGIEPDWIVGTSIGAITGAIVAGTARAERIERLRALWRPEQAREDAWPTPLDVVPEEWRRTGAVIETLLVGRPGLFGAFGSNAGWWATDDRAAAPALYDTRSLQETLERLVDFDRLNAGPMRVSVAAVDIESGEEVVIDTQQQRLLPDHVRASAALLTTFPAVAIDGRLLGDGGLAMNLPLDPVMADVGDGPVLCIAADLLPLAAPRPSTLGAVIGRMQDLTFAAQSARTIARWQAVRGDDPRCSIALALAIYAHQEPEVAGKAMDFSPRSVRHRWACGYADGRRLTDRLARGAIPLGRPGLTVHRF